MLLNRLKKRVPLSLKKKSTRVLQNAWQTPLYELSRNRNVQGEIRRIVFVCQGNVCRSAFAEYWLRSQLRGDQLTVESCGLNVDLSTPPPAGALNAGEKLGIDLSSHLSKSYRDCDLESADLLLAMQYSHWQDLIGISEGYRERLFLLRDFAPFPANLICNVHDPYGLGQEEFDHCFRLIRSCIKGLTGFLSRRGIEIVYPGRPVGSGNCRLPPA